MEFVSDPQAVFSHSRLIAMMNKPTGTSPQAEGAVQIELKVKSRAEAMHQTRSECNDSNKSNRKHKQNLGNFRIQEIKE
jgi:hypothetical protein